MTSKIKAVPSILTFKDLSSAYDLTNLFQTIYEELKKRTGLNNIDLVKNFIRVLFCKLYDETYHKDKLRFIIKDNILNTANSIKELFKQVCNLYNGTFKANEEIAFNDDVLFYLVSSLQYYTLTSSKADIIAQAFETIIADTLKGEHGQYFTPQEVVRFILNFIEFKDGFKVLDPACGTGTFIVESLKKMLANDDLKNETLYNAKKRQIVLNQIYGFDNNDVVSYIAKCYLSILGNENANIYTLNSLSKNEIGRKLGQQFLNGYFDVILTNPPYGNNIKVKDANILKDFTLASKNNNQNQPTNPEILFIEQCYNFLKEDGVVALVLPEGLFGNPSLKYVREFIATNFIITHIIDLPSTTFAPNTGIKTSVLILKKQSNWQNKEDKEETLNSKIHIFSIHNIGKDKQGKLIYKKDKNGNNILDSDLEQLKEDYKNGNFSNQYQTIPYKLILNNENLNFYANYWLNLKQHAKENVTQDNNFYYKTITDLINENVLAHTKNNKILTGNNPPSKFYFDGLKLKDKDNFVRFVRTSDINNFIINNNTQYYLSKETFKKYQSKQDLQENDILLVKDGYNKIGAFALVNDISILVQSHLFILRVLENNYGLNNFNLAYLLAKDDYLKEQIKNSIFTQGTIPTINTNFYNIKVRIPKDKELLKQYSKNFKEFSDTLNDIYKKFDKKHTI